MKFNRKITAFFSLIICLSMFALTVKADQPFMEAAKDNLSEAMKFLKKATADKGGHREQAITLTSQAIQSVKDGIKYDRTHPGDRPNNSSSSNFAGNNAAAPDQPNMVKARESLQKALDNLEKATADKGGFRVRAIKQVKDAIAQVNAGIEYDRTH